MHPEMRKASRIGSDGEKIEKARTLAAYAETAMKQLSALDESTLLAGDWTFPVPDAARAQ